MDKISKEQRSKNMAAIRGTKNKTTELNLAKILKREGITGWRRHKQGAYGTPDFLFQKSNLVLFTDGCFWHGCKKHCIMPKTNKAYWKLKIRRNKNRDLAVNAHYRAIGWKILRFWEHDIKKHPVLIIQKLKKKLSEK